MGNIALNSPKFFPSTGLWRFFRDWELVLSNLIVAQLLQKLFPLPITHYQKLRTVTQGFCGMWVTAISNRGTFLYSRVCKLQNKTAVYQNIGVN